MVRRRYIHYINSSYCTLITVDALSLRHRQSLMLLIMMTAKVASESVLRPF